MNLLNILGLATAMFLLAVTPGPGVFTTVSKALTSDFKQTFPVIIGIVAGDVFFLLLAIFGLSTIADTYMSLFILIKYLGGGYLMWLGIKLWFAKPQVFNPSFEKSQSKELDFLSGLSITLSNPKVIFFYLSLLPTFLDLAQLSPLEVIVIVFVVGSVLGSVMLFYAFTASRAKKVFQSKHSLKSLHKVAGLAMFGSGAMLLSKS